jgi:hypothetical protein
MRAGVSPDDPGYHQAHTHEACAERRDKRWGTPKSPSSSFFRKLVGAGAPMKAPFVPDSRDLSGPSRSKPTPQGALRIAKIAEQRSS